MSRVRTFIGLDLGKQLRARVVSLQEKLAQGGCDIKWVEPANLHVTLLFLGEVDDRDLISVCRTVQAGAKPIAPFSMSVNGVGGFPNLRRPRVVWAGIGHGAPDLVGLHDALEPPLLELGCYRREERQYTPHITLGRAMPDKPIDSLAAELAKLQNWQGGDTLITEVQVMSSELRSNGPTYAVLSRAKLEGDH